LFDEGLEGGVDEESDEDEGGPFFEYLVEDETEHFLDGGYFIGSVGET
jgi:hypothetical protein